MSSTRIIRNFGIIPLLTLTLIFAGCYASKFTLIAPDKARVDKTFLGDWDMVNKSGEHAQMIFRNIDDKLYYIEMREKDNKVDRYVGFTAPLGAATFAEVRPIKDDGTVPDEWFLMRIQLADGKLTLRQLDENFFKDKMIESADQLRAIVEKNIEADVMYDKEETLTGTKIVR